MIIRKLYNKILLREHPDLSPVLDPSFEKSHSFIFPGDEIVMCTKINAPIDLGFPFSMIKLQSVKMSVIAKKLNIYSEEYSEEYAATRSFELDSVTVPLTSLNAPIVPWGSDGYAPNINFIQDREWVLPSGDFRRQIKAFTDHTPSTSAWTWNFWFPFIFDERYWLALTAADNDFYDTAQPQNGKNDKWLRYHDLSALPFGWKIFMRFELNYSSLIGGGGGVYEAQQIISEYNLSNEQTEIQDYESNPDYALRSIKTCPVGGTPSNTPAYIFGDKNTSCFGYLTKQTAWEVGEKDNLSAVFRLRPSQGGDRLGSRGSSKYPATIDVVWVGNTNNIDTDSGLDILTDFGDELVIDDNGIPITISFDPMNDLNIIVQGEIDFNKLNVIFPNVHNFTLTCRWYNSTIYLP